MKILGVDPGLTATGYGVVEADDRHSIRLVETGIIKPNQRDLLQVKLDKVSKNLSDVIRQYQPEVMILEKLYAHYKHPSTAFVIGHVRGVICHLCAVHNIELVEHSVKRIRKSLLGNGNATKQQTRTAIAHILKIDAKNLTLDASDALALALGYARMHTLTVL